MNITNEKGVSLIELMVTLILALIFGLIVYSVFLMYNNSSRTSISFFFLQQQYDNLSHDVAKNVRKASYVLKASETPELYGAGYDTVSSIVLWNNSGVFTQYSISSEKFHEGPEEIEYEAGGGTVALNADSSYFIVCPFRKKVKLHLSLRRIDRNLMFTLSPREELMVCRN